MSWRLWSLRLVVVTFSIAMPGPTRGVPDTMTGGQIRAQASKQTLLPC